MLDNFERGIECGELFGSRVELLPANVLGRVDNLALQVARVHNIEIDQPQRANAGCCKVQGQRRTQPARADTKHLGSFQPLLPLHAHFGQNQVA